MKFPTYIIHILGALMQLWSLYISQSPPCSP